MKKNLKHILPLGIIFLSALMISGQTQIESVSFDKDLVYTICPGHDSSCPKDKAKIHITAIPDKVDSGTTFYYIPTGGEIVGTGSNVIWDFSNAAPGKYSITVGLGKNDILSGETISKTVTVTECPECDLACYCPSISVDGPPVSIRLGDSFIVHANVGGKPTGLKFAWTISNGTIVDGQGTNKILIKVPKGFTENSMKVSLEIKGLDPGCNCPNRASESFTILK